jgi:hypothetical protein
MLIKHYALPDRLSSNKFLFSVDTMKGKWHRWALAPGLWMLDAGYSILDVKDPWSKQIIDGLGFQEFRIQIPLSLALNIHVIVIT